MDEGRTPAGSGARNVGLDLLRGASMLYIVACWHLLDYTEPMTNHINDVSLRFTYVVLGAFTLVSGYFLGLKPVALSKDGLVAFYTRRLLRIYPPYALALAVFGLVGLTKPWDLLKAALAVSMLKTPAPMTLWFVAMLLLCYLIAPWLIAVCRAKRLSVYALLCIAILLGLLLYDRFTGWLDLRLVVYFPCFALGVYLASATREPRRSSYVLIPLLAITTLLSFTDVHLRWWHALRLVPMIVVGAYYLFVMTRALTIASPMLVRCVLGLSYVSYCVYLFHRPIYAGLKSLYYPAGVAVQIVYLLVVGVPIVALVSYAGQRAYDKLLEALPKRGRGPEPTESQVIGKQSGARSNP